MTTHTLARHLTHILVIALLALAVALLLAHPAAAATGTPAPGDGVPSFVWRLDVPQLLNLLLAVVFPVLVGLVTTSEMRSAWKAVILATISLASGLISALLNAVLEGVPFDILAALLTGLAAWIIALATYAGFWKPTGVANAVQSVGVRSRR